MPFFIEDDGKKRYMHDTKCDNCGAFKKPNKDKSYCKRCKQVTGEEWYDYE